MQIQIRNVILLLSLLFFYKMQRGNCDSADDYFNRRADVKFDALKKVHEFVYPKLYEAVDTVNNFSNARNITLNDILENSSETDGEAETKHANIDFGSSEHGLRPVNTFPSALNSSPNPNLMGLLCLVDPILLMSVLGFIVYLINTVLRLVERIHLGGNLSALINPVTPTSNILQRRNEFYFPTFEWNGALMKDLEKILQLAINTYEDRHFSMRQK